jgi:hypothetical protein
MKNYVRLCLLALALVLTWINTLSADECPSPSGCLSCGIACSTFNGGNCFYTYNPDDDSCVAGGWGCPTYWCA